MAERQALLGRDARERHSVQEQPGLPREPEEFCLSGKRGSPGVEEEDDCDDGDDDDGDDDARKR